MHSDNARPKAERRTTDHSLPHPKTGKHVPSPSVSRPKAGDHPSSLPLTPSLSLPLPRLMVAALASGSGKTLATCALLRILQREGLDPAAFKCGPDYIDPQFHRAVLGRPGGNLDGFFSNDDELRALLARGARDSGCAVIEGVMGFYDGLSLDSDKASSYAVARATGTPVVLVIDARGVALTAAAVVRGAQAFRPDAGIAGVILNRCSASLCTRLGPVIERECGIPVLGCLPADERFAMPSRHLGLVAVEELAGFGDLVDAAVDALAATLDRDRLLAIMRAAPVLDIERPRAIKCDVPQLSAAPAVGSAASSEFSAAATAGPIASSEFSAASFTGPIASPAGSAASPEGFASFPAGLVASSVLFTPSPASSVSRTGQGSPVIAVARDAAFSFYYEENLHMLEDLGARLVFFSPLRDTALPSGATGLYLGGGYPELHARELSQNGSLRADIARAVRHGMPTVAECGGFLYLQDKLEDADGHAWPMVGALSGEGSNAGRLGRFGYIEVTASRDCLYGPAGTTVRGHEFHYWRSTHAGEDFSARKPSGASWRTGVATPTLIAGFPHAYWPSNPDCAARFVQAAAAFGG